MKSIQEQIDELFANEADQNADQLRTFVSQLVDRQIDAERMSRRYRVSAQLNTEGFRVCREKRIKLWVVNIYVGVNDLSEVLLEEN